MLPDVLQLTSVYAMSDVNPEGSSLDSHLGDPCSADALVELSRRSSLTGKARYHSSRRLALHAWFSQWTLALLAVGQLVISLIPALGLKLSYSTAYMNFGSIFFGVLVLAYSLLLGMANFSAKAQRMHQCGLDLGRLSRRLHLWTCGSYATNAQYREAANSYYDILDKYENHTRLDYLVATHEQQRGECPRFQNCGFSKDYFLNITPLLCGKVILYFWHALQFSHYILSVLLIALWVYLGVDI